MTDGNTEIELLKTQVSQLMGMMTLLTAGTTVSPVEEVSESKQSANPMAVQVEKPMN